MKRPWMLLVLLLTAAAPVPSSHHDRELDALKAQLAAVAAAVQQTRQTLVQRQTICQTLPQPSAEEVLACREDAHTLREIRAWQTRVCASGLVVCPAE